MAPSDFSRMVVSPPALLPGDGLAFISAPSRAVYSSHQRISPTSFSPTSRVCGAAGQQVLGAVGLRRLGQDDGAALCHQQVAGHAERRVGGHAGIAVAAAALQRHGQLACRAGLAVHGIGLGQHLAHEGDGGLHGLARAAHGLDVHVADPIRQTDLAHHRAELVHLAAQPQHHDVAEIHVPRIATEGAAQQAQRLPVGHAAAGLVVSATTPSTLGNSASGIGAQGERVALEHVGHQPRHMGAAVHAGQDADIVAGGDAPIRAADAHGSCAWALARWRGTGCPRHRRSRGRSRPCRRFCTWTWASRRRWAAVAIADDLGRSGWIGSPGAWARVADLMAGGDALGSRPRPHRPILCPAASVVRAITTPSPVGAVGWWRSPTPAVRPRWRRGRRAPMNIAVAARWSPA